LGRFFDVWFFPESGNNYSPQDFIDDIQDVDERLRIIHTLTKLSDHPYQDWAHFVTIKKVASHVQMTINPHRLYFLIAGRKLVIYHICRKKSQKAKPSDIQRANLNRKLYYKED